MRRPISFALLLLVSGSILTGCAGGASVPTVGYASETHPLVFQRRGTSNWILFSGFVNPNDFNSIVAGRDGALWYTNGRAVDRISMFGKRTEFQMPSIGCAATIAMGGDGNLYIPDQCTGSGLQQVTEQGVVNAIRTPDDYSNFDDGIIADRAGNIWFTQTQHIAKYDIRTGVISEFAYTDGATFNRGGGVALGPDGDIWFTSGPYGVSYVSKIEPHSGKITDFLVNQACGGGIVAGPDGNMYFMCAGSSDGGFGKITTQGVLTYYSTGYVPHGNPQTIAVGPDGGIWLSIGDPYGPDLYEYQPTTGQSFYYYSPGQPGYISFSIVAGPDHNMWTTDQTLGNIEVYVPNPISVVPSRVFLDVGKTKIIVVSEQGTSSWAASSTRPGVATVAQGKYANRFDVTAMSQGQCNIFITDAAKNTFVVPVKVL